MIYFDGGAEFEIEDDPRLPLPIRRVIRPGMDAIVEQLMQRDNVSLIVHRDAIPGQMNTVRDRAQAFFGSRLAEIFVDGALPPGIMTSTAWADWAQGGKVIVGSRILQMTGKPTGTLNQHIDTLVPYVEKYLTGQFKANGFTVDKLREHATERAVWNRIQLHEARQKAAPQSLFA
jgi:hypothetical protein